MFWKCFWYLCGLSLSGFIIGRILPKSWFDWTKYPYAAYRFENGGRYYEKFHIRKWQNKLPDMSRIFKKIMPPKAVKGTLSKETLIIMIQETCIAEFTHFTIGFMGFVCLWLWSELGGFCMSLAYFLGNIPFILIQRYNRPRFIKVLNHIK